MRFSEHFARAGSPIISFELFPPKTDKSMVQLEEAMPRLLALRPSFFTVTYGALGSTQARTLEVVEKIRKVHGYEVASHLTCVGASRLEIDEILDRLERSGIENIVALRGDPPKDKAEFVPPPGGFAHASELVAHLRRRGGFGVAVAGYPEKHRDAPDLETDLLHLKQKVEAGGDIVITQLFFDNADFFRFERRLRELGVTVPVVPGILPIQSYAQVHRIAELCGARIPEPLRRDLEATGNDEQATEEVGARWAVAQCRELLERGAPGLHFYVLNRAAHMERILGDLRSQPCADRLA